jgi:D-alanyl-D-alanine carboxypeptidase/D-alanyl-D-alanine-endopeptidase (penicillin-binding protein 4)
MIPPAKNRMTKQEIKKVLKKVSPINFSKARNSALSYLPLLLPGLSVLFSFGLISLGYAQNRVIQGVNGGFYAECADGTVLYDRRGGDSFIPASTLKLLTAAAAIKNLGEDYRFKTEFFLSSGGDLVIKGYGDPTLVSEEVQAIAVTLASLRKNFNNVVVDGTEFEADIVVDGRSRSLNPYDARNGAVVVNFNTIALEKLANGKVRSAEPQTPLTPTAQKLGIKMAVGKNRISLEDNPSAPLQYAGELFKEFLLRNRVGVSGAVRIGKVAPADRLIYTHRSSKSLKVVLRDILHFSSNFGANQLMLIMGQEKFGGQANMVKGVRVVQEYASQDLNLRSLRLTEGSGLSRNNRISPREMVRILDVMAPYKGLLNDYKARPNSTYFAKTGTLNGVSSLAGFAARPDCDEVRFAVIINDDVPTETRHRIVEQLINQN